MHLGILLLFLFLVLFLSTFFLLLPPVSIRIVLKHTLRRLFDFVRVSMSKYQMKVPIIPQGLFAENKEKIITGAIQALLNREGALLISMTIVIMFIIIILLIFADDTTQYGADVCPAALQFTINQDIENITQWFTSN